MAGIVAVVAPLFIWSLRASWRRNCQKRTAVTLRMLGFALGTYGADYGYFPQASNVEALVKVLGPTSLDDPAHDAWDAPIRYEWYGPTACAVGSAGGDGVFQHSSFKEYDEKLTHYYDCDLVYRFDTEYTSGWFIRLPYELRSRPK